jgi:hypothetical protein
LVRIKPKEIKKKGSVPTNGSIFFTIFQTFMSGKKMQRRQKLLNLELNNTILDNTQKTILILSLLTSATVAEQMMKETGEAF